MHHVHYEKKKIRINTMKVVHTQKMAFKSPKEIYLLYFEKRKNKNLG